MQKMLSHNVLISHQPVGASAVSSVSGACGEQNHRRTATRLSDQHQQAAAARGQQERNGQSVGQIYTSPFGVDVFALFTVASPDDADDDDDDDDDGWIVYASQGECMKAVEIVTSTCYGNHWSPFFEERQGERGSINEKFNKNIILLFLCQPAKGGFLARSLSNNHTHLHI